LHHQVSCLQAIPSAFSSRLISDEARSETHPSNVAVVGKFSPYQTPKLWHCLPGK
jgi:hypothetical protein